MFLYFFWVLSSGRFSKSPAKINKDLFSHESDPKPHGMLMLFAVPFSENRAD